jgi:MinD-like ATPase involved in chromosome partitioning or flagellar assembly
VESFFAGKLAIEIAKNDRTVTLIDFGFERSIVRHLLRSSHPEQDVLLSSETVYPDYKLESLQFRGLPEITLISPAVPPGRNVSERTLGRIFEEDRVRERDVVLINSPMGPVEVRIPEMQIPFQRAVVFLDDQILSLINAYSWIKQLSRGCLSYLVGAVCGGVENSGPVPENVPKLQRTIFKHLLGLELRVVQIPLDQETGLSMQSGKPPTLVEPSVPSSTAAAIAKLCRNLLRNE